MGILALSLLSAIALLVLAECAQSKKPYISTAAEIPTECKTCPRSLCPNTVFYDGEETLNVTCWTRGTNIMGNGLWLRSEAGCYVTQYDLYEYDGEYESDLAYCGRDSEEQDLTTENNTLKYKTECRITPELNGDVVAYLKEDTDVELTCWYPDGQIIIDDPIWFKTTNNCYVAQRNLYSKPDITYLDPCGPVGHLEQADHNNINGTSDVNKRAPASLDKRYLINVTVGEEYAHCYSCPRTNCTLEKTYEFDQEVIIQCITERYTVGEVWWSQTTDFCYVKNTDFWQCPECDYYRNPVCDYFPDGWGSGPDPTLPGSDPDGDGPDSEND